MKTKKRYRRGYPVAILAGIEEDTAVLWKVFSNVAKPEKTIQIDGARNDPKDLYNFHESIINALRPTLKEGVRSIILASPARTNHHQDLINHVREHHKWLTQGQNKAAFSKITGSAATPSQVAALTRTPSFLKLINDTTEEETEPVPNLDCSGNLEWTDVTPGDTVTGSFTVSNIGDSGSLLDWEIDDEPGWGTWTFTPESGMDLTPEASPTTVQVKVVAPAEQKTEFTGEIRIVNMEDSNDYCTIPVRLVTPKNQHSTTSQILQLLQQHLHLLP